MSKLNIPLVLLQCLILGGCLDGASNPAAPEPVESPGEPLTFRAPNYPATDSDRPALVGPGDEDGDGETDPPDDVSRPLQRIINPRTITGFWPGKAWAEGANNYVGNVGSIETTAKLWFEETFLAEQPVFLQDYKPFLFDFGEVKFIHAFAPISSDHECGLTVRGSSLHQATWQWFLGSGAPLWGTAAFTSVADHTSQASCPDTEPDPVGMTGSGPGGSTCYFRVTYDVESGEPIHIELLYCTGGSGGGP